VAPAPAPDIAPRAEATAEVDQHAPVLDLADAAIAVNSTPAGTFDAAARWLHPAD
jgi:hypothetical protein